MKISSFTQHFEAVLPLAWAESYDRCGFTHTTSSDTEIKHILCALDCTPAVVRLAKELDCQLIVTHHPLYINGIDDLGSFMQSSVGEAFKLLCQFEIGHYTAHTNLDNAPQGINHQLGSLIGLASIHKVAAQKSKLYKLSTYLPINDIAMMRDHLSACGAGELGEYKNCSFSSYGVGTFHPSILAKPAVGKGGEINMVEEAKLEMLFPDYLQAILVDQIHKHHPYEQPAIDIIALEQYHPEIGGLTIGYFKPEIAAADFLDKLCSALNLKNVKISGKNAKIHKVAIASGAGASYYDRALAAGCDAFITSEIKHHQFIENNDMMLLVDIGHSESEIIAANILQSIINTIAPNLKTSLYIEPAIYHHNP